MTIYNDRSSQSVTSEFLGMHQIPSKLQEIKLVTGLLHSIPKLALPPLFFINNLHPK